MATLLVACARPAPAPAPPQMISASEAAVIAARAVADSFYSAIAEERWTDAAQWLDLDRFREFEQRRVRQTSTLATEFGDSSRDVVLALPTAQAAAHWLERQDVRTAQLAQWRRNGCTSAFPAALVPIVSEFVVGTVVRNDSTVYVLRDEQPFIPRITTDGMPNSPRTATVSHTTVGWRIVPEFGVSSSGAWRSYPCGIDTATSVPGLSCGSGFSGGGGGDIEIDLLNWGCGAERLRAVVLWKGASGWHHVRVQSSYAAKAARMDSLLRAPPGQFRIDDAHAYGATDDFGYGARIGGTPRRFVALRSEAGGKVDTIAGFPVGRADSLAVLAVDRIDGVGGAPTARLFMLPRVPSRPVSIDDPDLAAAINQSPELVAFLGNEAPDSQPKPAEGPLRCTEWDHAAFGGISIDFLTGGCAHPGLLALVMWRGFSSSEPPRGGTISPDSTMAWARRSAARRRLVSHALQTEVFGSQQFQDTTYAVGSRPGADFMAVRTDGLRVDTLATLSRPYADSVLVTMIDYNPTAGERPIVSTTAVAPVGCVPRYGIDPAFAQMMKREGMPPNFPGEAPRQVCGQAARAILGSPVALRFLTSRPGSQRY